MIGEFACVEVILTKEEKQLHEQELSPEKKFLTALYSEEVFAGALVRQDKPFCCGREINIFTPDVTFKEIVVGKTLYHLIEPLCPSCGKRVKATYALIT